MNIADLLRYKDPQDLDKLIETLAVCIGQNEMYGNEKLGQLPGSLKGIATSVLSYRTKLDSMTPEEINLVWQSASYLVKELTGISAKEIDGESKVIKNRSHSLDGNYWILPGIKGFIKCDNHCDYLQDNWDFFCNSLEIDGWDFFHAMHSNQKRLMPKVIGAGAIRAHFTKGPNNRRVGFFQTSQASLPWLKSKINSMPLLKAVVKIIDPHKPYEDWKSGILFVLKK
jgi:hypothetical protein